MSSRVHNVRNLGHMILTSTVAVVFFGQSVAAGTAGLQAREGDLRLIPNRSSARPGEVVTLQVSGSGQEGLRGGVASLFERKTRAGWQRLYLLHWFGRGEPSVRDPNSLVEDLLVPGTSFPVVVPPVKPGTYRITRRYVVDPGVKDKDVNLSAKLKVLQCPNRQSPRFVPSSGSADPLSLGIPQCVS